MEEILEKEELQRVIERLRQEFEELEALRSAADGLRVFRERMIVVDDARFD